MRDRFIGMFDVLGFKHLIESKSLKTVVARADRIVQTAKGVVKIPDGKAVERLKISIFQDTVVVVTDGVTAEELKTIVQYSCALIGFGFSEGFMFRGAIVRGEAHVGEHMIIGKGIVRAYQMEQNQDWMGGWLDDRCVALAPKLMAEYLKQLLIVRYSVPLKSGTMRETWALNWTWPLLYAQTGLLQKSWNRVWRPACMDGKVTWDVRRKLEQTDRFLTNLARSGWLANPKTGTTNSKSRKAMAAGKSEGSRRSR